VPLARPPAEGDVGGPSRDRARRIAALGGAVSLAMRARRVAPRHAKRGRDGRQANEIDQLRIELRPASLLKRPQARVEAARGAVAPGDGDRIDRVGDRHDPRGERDRRAADPPGIPATIPALVVREHAALQFGIERRERGEDGGAAPRVGGDCRALRRRQSRPVVDQVEERFVDLPDVVEEGDALDDVALARREVGRLRDDERVARHAPHVRARLRVGGIDGVEERFEHRRRQPLGAPSIPIASYRLTRSCRPSHAVPSSNRPCE